MKLPDLTLQLNEVQPHSTEKQVKPQYSVRTMEETTIAPNQQTTLKCNLLSKKTFADVRGRVEPKNEF